MSNGEDTIPITGPEHRKEYYPYFDWLRIVLAAVVMLFHDGVIPWGGASYIAVQVFFALSGWLIGGILLEMRPAGLTRFYFNRVARIWGPYFVALAILIGVSLLRDPITPKWSEFVFYKTTFVYNVFGPPQLAEHRHEMPLDGSGNHFWSVDAEEQFYLFAPLLLVVVSPIIGRSVTTWLILSLFLLWYCDLYASIALGVTATVARAKFGPLHRQGVSRLILSAVVIATTFAMLRGWNFRALSPPFSIAVVMLLATIGQPTRIGAVAGGISYPLYLNHWLGHFIAHSVFKRFGSADSVAAHVTSNLLSLLIAGVLYVLVDRTLLKRRSQYFTPTRGRAAMIIAYGLVIVGLCVGLVMTYS